LRETEVRGQRTEVRKGEEKTLQIRETQRRAEGGDRGQRSEDRGQEMIVIHSN